MSISINDLVDRLEIEREFNADLAKLAGQSDIDSRAQLVGARHEVLAAQAKLSVAQARYDLALLIANISDRLDHVQAATKPLIDQLISMGTQSGDALAESLL